MVELVALRRVFCTWHGTSDYRRAIGSSQRHEPTTFTAFVMQVGHPKPYPRHEHTIRSGLVNDPGPTPLQNSGSLPKLPLDQPFFARQTWCYEPIRFFPESLRCLLPPSSGCALDRIVGRGAAKTRTGRYDPGNQHQ